MNRIEAAFYLLENPNHRVVDMETGDTWVGLHRSPVTNNTVLPMSVINKLPDHKFKVVENK